MLEAIRQWQLNELEGAQPQSHPSLTLSVLMVFAAYYVGAKFGLALTFEPYPISVLWPPNAILLSALLLAPARWWPALVLAVFPAHLLAELPSGVPAPMVLLWFVSNVSEGLIGAACVRWAIGRVPTLDNLREVAVLLVGGTVVAAFLSSFLDAAFVTAIGFGTRRYWDLWSTRFLSNTLATLTLAPVIVTWMTWSYTTRDPVKPARLTEAVLLALGLIAASIFAFGLPTGEGHVPPALLYLPLPFLLWAALRFGTVGASSAFMLVALLVIWGAGHGRGPFTEGDPVTHAQSVQFFLMFVGATVLVLAAIVQERKRAELALRRSEERFATAFRTSPDAIAIIRQSDGALIEMNERWPELSHDAAYTNLVELLRGQRQVHNLEVPLKTTKGEELQALVSIESVELDGEACMIAIVRDITDRKRAAEANDRLAHVSRLAVMGELTASIAHEISQPLGAILSNADAAEMLLASDTVPVTELRQILEDIRRDDLRVSDVIQHMRVLMRRRALAMEPFDLNRAITDVLQLVGADLAKLRVTVSTRLGALPTVHGDHVHIQQVVMNLLLNALDAMKGGCRIPCRIDVITEMDDGRAKVTVADNGPGIQPEHLPRLFESFFTTKESGMGLGLAITRSIVEAHSGRIYAENGPQGGARFHFTIPIAAPAGPSPARTAPDRAGRIQT